MRILPIKTSLFHQGGSLRDFILENIPTSQWQESSLLAITSKIISLSENRVATKEHNKLDLIQCEADYDLGEIGHNMRLTIKEHLLLPAAGIDESNSPQGHYILYPQSPYQTAQTLLAELKTALHLQKLGLIITDSRSGPLRHGVVGACVAFAGFHPVRDMRGEKDLFDRPLKVTKVNLADSLAAAAVVMMGEGSEQCPLTLIEGAPVQFSSEPVSAEELVIPPNEDIYLPLYQHRLKKSDRS
ncbi:MAG: coenzyme F420-0:L-glutamate ligase [Bdellovibrio sp.]